MDAFGQLLQEVMRDLVEDDPRELRCGHAAVLYADAQGRCLRCERPDLTRDQRAFNIPPHQRRFTT